MSPAEKGRAFLRDLVGRIHQDLAAAETQLALAREQLDLAGSPPSVPVMAFVSVSIDRAYTALEAAFLRIAREVDVLVPSGAGWHAALVHQMALAIQDCRPAVLRADTVRALAELREHRHWLRHAYSATFVWTAMAKTVHAFPDAIRSAREDLDAFVLFLETEP